MWLCITPTRVEKTERLMSALHAGWPGSEVIEGPPPDDGSPFTVWGQRWLTEEVLPAAIEQRRPFWHIDNGYWMPSRGQPHGHYRMTYRGLSPILLLDCAPRPLAENPPIRPWRTRGKHIVLAMPGATFGIAAGLDMSTWIGRAAQMIQRNTDRPILVRAKDSRRPLGADLRNAWALVTHSSNVAVEAVMAGTPVFVAETSPAAPVGNWDLRDLERPVMPEREHWFRSLMCQQFLIAEMRDGTAYRCLNRVREQVDG